MSNTAETIHTWQEKVAEKFRKKGMELYPDIVELLKLLHAEQVSYSANGRNRERGTYSEGFIILQNSEVKVRLDILHADKRTDHYICSLAIREIIPYGITWIKQVERDIRTPEGGGLLYSMFSEDNTKKYSSSATT